MPYKYELGERERLREILRCAYQDRSGMIESLRSGDDMTEDDKEYLAECLALCRDIVRMDANLKLRLFHSTHAARLSDSMREKDDCEGKDAR